VRTKLVAVLVIPALALITVGGLLTGLSLRQAAALAGTADQVALGRQVTALVHELQLERDRTAGQAAAGTLTSARAAVDVAATAFLTAAGPLRDRPDLRTALAHATGALDELTVLRAGLDEGWLHRRAVFDGYRHTIDALLDLLRPPAEAQGHTRGVLELAELKELRSQIRGQVYAVARAGGFRASQAGELVDTRAQHRAAVDRFRSTADPPQVARFDESVRGQAVATAARLENALLAQTTATGLRGVDAERWWSAATTELELVRAAEIALLADVLNGIERARADQWRQTGLVTGVTLAILALSLLTSAGIGRSMGTSLRRLHARAMDVAHVQLPDLLARLRQPATPLPQVDQVTRTAAAGLDGAGGADEVGEVARAFTEVHRAAVGLAVEQARMRRNVGTIFVHLARRSQVLVERQLELLDDLERDETEPDRLKNLFLLDHLATRQRRNNDSLLALADADTVRRYDLPTPLHGAAVAAVAEIEAYERVHDRVTAEERVAGHAVADLVHLLAELLDNATTFSEPHTIVTVTDQRWTGPGGDTGIVLVVADAGMGMSAEALAAANALLAEPPPIDVATSERMGLVVVGHLAARHGIQVRLDDASPGVRATVWLPAHLLTAALPAALPAPVTAPRDRLPALPGGAPPGAGNLWWARPDEQPAPPTRTPGLPLPAGPAPAAPHPPAVNGRTRTNGLPIRTPLAQLPAGRAAAPLPPPAPLVHQDPDQAGAALSALYRGVRQAQSELDGEPPTQEFKPIEKDHRDEPEPTSP
jgi:hypothetical protein